MRNPFRALLLAAASIPLAWSAEAQTATTAFNSIPVVSGPLAGDQVLIYRPGLVTPTTANPTGAAPRLLSVLTIGQGSTGGYTLPAATATTIGGVKCGSGVSCATDGTLTILSGGSSLQIGTTTGTAGDGGILAALGATVNTAVSNLAALTTSVSANTTAIGSANTAIGALQALGGRYQGTYASGTAYKQGDLVMQGNQLLAANAAFTSGTFNAANWTVIANLLTLGTTASNAAPGDVVAGLGTQVAGNTSAITANTAAIAANALLPTSATYTASGAIAPANRKALVSAASGTLNMTLAAGTTDGQQIVIKRFGVAAVNLTATIDGATSTIAMNKTGTPYESVGLMWDAPNNTWELN